MFTLFHDPFYYRPTYWFQQPRYYRRPSLFERYLDALDQRFFSILSDDAAELLKLEEQSKGESASNPTATPISTSASASPSASASASPSASPSPNDDGSIHPAPSTQSAFLPDGT